MADKIEYIFVIFCVFLSTITILLTGISGMKDYAEFKEISVDETNILQGSIWNLKNPYTETTTKFYYGLLLLTPITIIGTFLLFNAIRGR